MIPQHCHRLRLLDLSISKMKAADRRAELLGVPTGTETSDGITAEVKEEEEEMDLEAWKRKLVINLRQLAIKLGLLTDYSYEGDER
jgi:hypothetical protein